jgi:hypothetical protein
MQANYAFWQHSCRKRAFIRESPHRRRFFAVKHAASRAVPSADHASAALHERPYRVKMAFSRALPHLFTEPCRYN